VVAVLVGEAVRGVLDTAQQEVLREARLLARDPVIVEGAARRDWATLARGASPRMVGLTAEKVAVLVQPLRMQDVLPALATGVARRRPGAMRTEEDR
jgi:hypothetical protein